MGTATVRGTRTLQRRRIIQRPRLLAQLDASSARVRMLIAAAGYGKSTLAEQWVATGERRSAWYTVRRASLDVAGLALGLARACSVVIAGCDERLRAHLKAVSASTGSSTVLAEILCEDLADWPSDAWLVVDDYQEISGSHDAESLVADVVSGCPLQILLTSRQRPSWATARSILYGEILEVGQASLAMDPQEAAEVLADWSGPAASGLVALANGWPAVIGLASVSSAEIEGEGDATVPESLYRFFADEVFDALGDAVREGLTLLAVAPVLDRELADELLGEARAEVVCGTATDVGLLVERDSRLELHPLARSFLDERAVATPAPSAIATCLAHYRARHDWDAAFDLIVRRDELEELEGLLEAALDDLLDSARLSTIEDWCDHAQNAGLDEPFFALARAETALRHGRQARAQAYAEVAARSPELAFRALLLAGRAAHLASHEQRAVELYARAEEFAEHEAQRREARWNQVMTSIDLNPSEVRAAFESLRSDVTPASPREFVKASTCGLSIGARSGAIEPSEGEMAWELIPVLADPLLETSFESIYSTTLALAARYDEALEVATALLTTARHYRFRFARPYGLIPTAMAHAGKRNWGAAHDCLSEASHLGRDAADQFVACVAYATRVRLLVQQGRHPEAVALLVPGVADVIPALRAEVVASRALALAVGDRLPEAMRIVNALEDSQAGVEAAVLCETVVGVASLKRNQSDALERVHLIAETAFATGAVDLLVTAYRSVPQILEILLRDPRDIERVRDLVDRIGDGDLLGPLGQGTTQGDRRSLLTARELEVYNLLSQGLSNRQIAAVLVISGSTAKLHVQHVYNKLGVHSRRALVVQAALERSGQATSATGATDKGASSDD